MGALICSFPQQLRNHSQLLSLDIRPMSDNEVVEGKSKYELLLFASLTTRTPNLEIRGGGCLPSEQPPLCYRKNLYKVVKEKFAFRKRKKSSS